ncbi:hypothetical protein [Clostridium luticellarii]|jgi:hypothetical protein|uniref:hypothetical protein n=1 Tax=Clostridium luticellarii TaxID=1691940 RepID=UPI0023533021|nr:hypothetical protein [Clostridium luticellarii]MCI1943952.1 hypothetical protein [Clostridium luticellarii]MCI1967213.1 hypothetical protein [Clostridium luticellarii]MCI1995944.1 hypothetical protein [Clostridium luticellarii]MCI2038467.1 hypothetical protein [Clostridium luticellarii]
MLNIIKTAVITIIISFISGLLLDYYKNWAPKILCTIKNGIPLKIDGKKIYQYIINVSNVSSKIVHDLTLNIQSSKNNLRIKNAKITKGLKFDSSIKDNILDVYIPFLSKNDKFSVILYVESQNAVQGKPSIVIRSPEKFRQIDSIEQKGFLQSIKKDNAAPHKVKDDFTRPMNRISGTKKTINRKPLKGKKAIILTVSIILVIIAGALGKSYLKGTSANTSAPDGKNTVHKQSTDTTNGSDKNADTSTGKSTGNTGNSTTGTGKSTDTNTPTSTDGSAKDTNTKTSTDDSTKNTNTKTSTDTSTGDKTSSTPSNTSNGNSSSSSSTENSSGNSSSDTSTEDSSGNSGSDSSTGGTSGNTGN